MKAKEILRSNFKHYKFIVYENDTKQTHFEIKYKYNSGYASGEFDLVKNDELPYHYDIGYSLRVAGFNVKSANAVATLIDKSKLFIVDEFHYNTSNETLYVYCKLKKG